MAFRLVRAELTSGKCRNGGNTVQPIVKSFWTTLPGMLTGLAGFVSATALLLTALYTTGVLGRTPPAPTAPTEMPQPGNTLASEPSALPAPKQSSPFNGARAFLSCHDEYRGLAGRQFQRLASNSHASPFHRLPLARISSNAEEPQEAAFHFICWTDAKVVPLQPVPPEFPKLSASPHEEWEARHGCKQSWSKSFVLH
jgi:hypothetical protein